MCYYHFRYLSRLLTCLQLRDSVTGDSTSTLGEFALVITARFRDGGILGRGEITYATKARLSVMVRVFPSL